MHRALAKPLAIGALLIVLLGVALHRSLPAQQPDAARLRNPVTPTQQALVTGKAAYDTYCAACHGNRAQGAEKAGLILSIIQEQGRRQAPELTDATWDHGSSDGHIFDVIKKGVPGTMMAGYDGRVPDAEIWSIVTYLRALAADPTLVVAATAAAVEAPRPRLQLAEYARAPITGQPGATLTRGLLARLNFMRDEPGGARFFVNDLNGPLYILDKETRAFTTYLDFNGRDGRPGLFPKLTFEQNFAMGLTNFVFDPDYRNNGIFYTIHMEDPATPAPAPPKADSVPGLDLRGYTTTPAIVTPTADGRIAREAVLIEWTDRDITNTTFEGTARELMRLQLPGVSHPLGEFTFNPAARPGDADWRVMYVGSGDAGTGEQRDVRRFNPQRLDTLGGKILRIIPDLDAHMPSSRVSANGRYRVPNDNPFVDVAGARPEIWAVGLRNPHRFTWYTAPDRPGSPYLLAFNIGLHSWETIVIVERGANYGYPFREGTQAMTPAGMAPLPADDTIPVHISDTATRGTVKPTYPVIAYPHLASGGDAIASGFVYRGTEVPALKDKLLFGDITTGRMWYAEIADVLRANDGVAGTVAPIQEVDADLRRIAETTMRERGGSVATLTGVAPISGRGRVDMRLAEDADGELYVLTKSDGMIRKVVGLHE